MHVPHAVLITLNVCKTLCCFCLVTSELLRIVNAPHQQQEQIMKKIILGVSIGLAAALSGCATYDSGYSSSGYSSGGYYGDRYSSGHQNSRSYGVVVSTRNVEVGHKDYRGPGFGAVAGAIIGGVLGNQIGSGSGRALATAGGAVAGGFAGDAIERNSSGSRWGQEVVVDLDNGDRVTLLQPGTSLYRGARVQITGYGSNARAVLR